MSPFKINVFYLFIFNIFVAIHSLVELPTAEDNAIAVTEYIIRNTINNLFSALNVKGVKHKPRIKQFSTIHNFFVTLTLQDHETFNEITTLSRIRRDNTSFVITILDELLNEDISDETNDEIISEHVEAFLNNLRNLKERFSVNNPSRNTVINEELWEIVKDKIDLINITNNGAEKDAGDNVLDDLEFWQESGRRVYRGEITKAKYFPFMASIQFFNKFQCGGSIIKSDLVITAASCLQLAYNNRFFRENPAFLSVRVGSNFYEGGGENIPILEVFFHPSYNPKNLQNNLVILRLIKRINFSRKQKKVKKIDFDRIASKLPENTDGITIVGWGARDSSNILGDPWHNRLSYAVLDFYPLHECREIYTKEYVTDTNFCAGFFSKGGGACNRDVGGPGVVNGLLTGVVSFGSPVCGAPDAPTVFTKVGYYTDWIEEIMEQDVPVRTQRTTLKPLPIVPTIGTSDIYVPTTFKIQPVMGKMRPLPAEPIITTASPAPDDLNALRILSESDLFNKYLESMFESKEIEEYAAMANDLRENAEKDESNESTGTVEDVTEVTEASIINIVQTITELPLLVTKLEVYDVSQETAKRSHKKYTVSNENLTSSVEGQFEKDIVQLFGDIDLAKLIEETKGDDKSEGPMMKNEFLDLKENGTIFLKDDDDMKLALFPDAGDNIKEPRGKKVKVGSVKNLDDSVLTLLYLTENEKKLAKLEDDSDEGLSIPADSNTTYMNDRTGHYNFEMMSQSDLLNLLTEAINSEINDDDAGNGTVANMLVAGL